MKILFVGTFEKPWSTHHPQMREFKKKTPNVIKFDFRYIPKTYRRIKSPIYTKIFKKYFDSFVKNHLLPIKLRNIRYYLFGNWMMNKQLVNVVKNGNFDLVFFGKAEQVNYKIIPKINKYSKSYYYFMDPLHISHKMNAHKYAALCSISSASTTAMNTLFKREGANSYYLLEGYDENNFSPGEENKHKEIDVIFCGRITPIRKKFIDFLRENNINVVCHGNGWENEPIYLKTLVETYRKSKIILNFPREDSGFSDRVFQSMGTGSLLLSNYCSDLKRVFKKGVHNDWFKTKEECLERVKYYLENNEKREIVSQNGYNYVSNNFTYEKNIENIIQIAKDKLGIN